MFRLHVDPGLRYATAWAIILRPFRAICRLRGDTGVQVLKYFLKQYDLRWGFEQNQNRLGKGWIKKCSRACPYAGILFHAWV
jgi:hypothetical protein